MTKSQVRYLLGGPVIGNHTKLIVGTIFTYIKRMSGDPLNNDQRYWLVVYFENEIVTKIEKDVLTRLKYNFYPSILLLNASTILWLTTSIFFENISSVIGLLIE